MKRILFVSESLGEPNHQRGIFHFTRELARSLNAEGHELTLLVERTARFRSLRRDQRRARLFPENEHSVELLALYRFLGDVGVNIVDMRSSMRKTVDWVRSRLQAILSVDVLICLAQAFIGRAMRGAVIANAAAVFDYLPAELEHLKLFHKFRLDSGIYSYQELSALARLPAPRLDVSGYDLVIVDSPTRIAMAKNSRARIVGVVHDLLPITDIRLSDVATHLFLFRLTTTLRNATELLFVSEYTRDRFRQLLPKFADLPGKVVFPRTRFPAQLPRREPVSRPTFVVIVSYEYRKNLPTLIRAFAKLPQAQLVIIGSLGRASIVRRLPENVTYTGFVDDQEKQALMGDATALIMPSLAEGFGVPIIEAFAANVPVLCSDIAVFREVAGDLAIYFDPLSSASMRDAIVEAIATERALRDRIAGRRDELIHRFGTLTHARDILAPCPPRGESPVELHFAPSQGRPNPAVGAL
ncbi:glycosyltransferase family 1 protein [Methylocapsa sp. S129]|uniref:glycosyltransferase family 4 protein n=1 Tax=Methylocapsa sp. S129 TaxID=1641869 RepID=UPI00131D216E|nr:glycosyltransferase family 1 protein [Methylocapsa sp. S129]